MTFQPPNLEQIEAYVREKNLAVDPEWFFNYFEAGDWIDSLGHPVKSWKQKLWTHHTINFKKNGGNGKTKLYPIKGKFCAETRNNRRCGMPAVYKSSGGAYDFYYCAECMPAKVKERYE